MTNWVELQLMTRHHAESEIERRAYEKRLLSTCFGLLMWHIKCLRGEACRLQRTELGIQTEDFGEWLGLFFVDYTDDFAEIAEVAKDWWQPPGEAARKFRTLAVLFERRGPAAEALWRGIFEDEGTSDLAERAAHSCVHTDCPSPGCASGDWACHFLHCCKGYAELLDELASEGEDGVLLTFYPFY